jgi:hypothetical protein
LNRPAPVLEIQSLNLDGSIEQDLSGHEVDPMGDAVHARLDRRLNTSRRDGNRDTPTV